MKFYFGVDIGGTQTKFGLFSKTCELLARWSVKTDLSEAGRNIIPSIAREIEGYVNQKHMELEDVQGIGMGIPGPVDEIGYVKTCVNLYWHEFNPREELQLYFPAIHIAAGNDANLAALGEYYRGAGKTYRSMMLITLGTGVGGGIVLDGRILAGAHGLAGEIGHISTGAQGEEKLCNCGNKGCIDQFASATGIVRMMRKILSENNDDSKLRKKRAFTAKMICDAAEEGDKLAQRCIHICMGELGKGLAYFSHAFDPEAYVIGGGVSGAGKLITDAIEKEYRRHLFLISEGAHIRLAKLGNSAGITGACILAMGGRINENNI